MRSKFSVSFFVFLMLALAMVYYLLILKQIEIANERILISIVSSQQKLIKKYPFNQADYLSALYEILSASNHLVLITDSRGNQLFNSNNWSPVENPEEFGLLTKKPPLIINLQDQHLLLYYQPSPWLKQLTFFPVFQAFLLFLVLWLFYFLYNLGKKNEKNLIWVAMAKETAHQLGTPVTSLTGWKDYIQDLCIDNSDLKIVSEGIEEDLKRVNLVISRFSLVASKPEMSFYNLKNQLLDVTAYISRRLPLQDPKIEINTDEIAETGNVLMNPLLLSWAVENVVKNAIQSIVAGKNGLVKIRSVAAKDKIIIDISDNGCGIKSRYHKEIFATGYTTKKRGWGIGLSLAKRVIEDYHHGKIFVKESQIGKGTVIQIELNRLV